MRRRPARGTSGSFKRRVTKTARLNLASPRRGGIRL